MGNRALVSVIIPVLNGETYITEAVESVLNQTYPSSELIVVDDGSTDDTKGMLQAYGERLRYVYQPNSGVSAARNHGLRLARGEHVVFLDADDVLLPAKLAGQVACLAEQAAAGCVHSGWHVVDSQGEWLATAEPWNDAPQLDLEAWLTWCPFYLPAMMFRRHWLEAAGGFDTSLRQAEDADLLLRMSLLGCAATWLRQPTVRYRQHGSSTMHHGVQQAESIWRVMSSFFARPDLPVHARRLENTVLLNTLMWCAWHLYATGHTGEITEYLRKSVDYAAYPPTQTVRFWLGVFAGACADKGHKLDDLRVLWPRFKAAIQVDEPSWQQIEPALNRWLKVMMVLHVDSER